MIRQTLLTLLTGVCCLTSTYAEERETQSPEDLIPFTAIRDALTGEMGDIARALRSVDQSFAYRGMRGCGSCTAGSVFIDWEAKGVKPPQGKRILPPPPLDLSGRNGHYCRTCGEDYYDEICGCHELTRVRVKDRTDRHDRHCDDCPPGAVAVRRGGHHIWVERTPISKVTACREAGTFAIQFRVRLAEECAEQFTPILYHGLDWRDANIAVGQVGHALRFRFKTDRHDVYGTFIHEVDLGELCCSKDHCVAIEYRCGHLVITIDEAAEVVLTDVEGELSNWECGSFTFADCRHGWCGQLRDFEFGTCFRK